MALALRLSTLFQDRVKGIRKHSEQQVLNEDLRNPQLCLHFASQSVQQWNKSAQSFTRQMICTAKAAPRVVSSMMLSQYLKTKIAGMKHDLGRKAIHGNICQCQHPLLWHTIRIHRLGPFGFPEALHTWRFNTMLDHAEHEKNTINICRALFERCLQSKLQKIQDMDPSCEFCSRKLPFKKTRTHVK